MSDSHSAYYVPDSSYWPLFGSVALFLVFLGSAMMLNGQGTGNYVLILGLLMFFYLLFGWFRDVIIESHAGKYNAKVDMSFRWGMGWFIFSEVMFFAAFFGALFYARVYSGPWLAGEGAGFSTWQFLYPDFTFTWPMEFFPDGTYYTEPGAFMGAWGLPAINTFILLMSGLTITLAHHALKKDHRKPLAWWLFATIALGVIFLFVQGYEYIHAYRDLGLTLNSGVYGSTFFMLTGFHGFHVTMGALMLLVIWFRVIKGHFSSDNHFGFEAVAWYWHFVDVVWLGLFVFVYWL